MTAQNLQVRRATIEDLPKLAALWQTEGLPVGDLEKRFKEFQLVEKEDGSEVLGTVGLQIAGAEGRLHSEAFARPEVADQVRELVWERAQVLAQNHGLVRLWSQFSTPFWNHSGFQYASAETLAKLPPAFGQDPQPWRFLQLKEETGVLPSVDKEFAMFKEMEREQTARLLRQAKLMKMVAALVVLAVFFLVAFWVYAWFRTQNRLPR